MEEVRSSILLSSTALLEAWWEAYRVAGSFFGGLLAAEGSFFTTTNNGTFSTGERRRRFVLSLSLTQWDRELVVALQAFLGVGHLRDLAPQRQRLCTVEGCERPRRARQLCRRPHYLAFGR
jgi:hypothetical protein